MQWEIFGVDDSDLRLAHLVVEQMDALDDRMDVRWTQFDDRMGSIQDAVADFWS